MASSGDSFAGQTMFVRMKKPPYTVTGKIEAIVPGKGVVLQVWPEGRPYPQRLEIASDDIEDLSVQDVEQQQQPPKPKPQGYQQPLQAAPAPPVQHHHHQQRMPFPAYQQNMQSPMIPHTPTQYPPAYHSYQQQHQHAIPSPLPPQVPHQPAPQQQQHVPTAPHQPKAPFVDPAILSMGKPPVRPSPAPATMNKLPSAVTTPSTAQQPPSALANNSLPKASNGTTQSPIPKIFVGNVPQPPQEEIPQTAILDPMHGLSLGARAELSDKPVEIPAADLADPEEQDNQSSQKKIRRRNRPSKKNTNEQLDVEASPARGTRPDKKGKGWRETPMLENTATFQPYKALRKTKINQDGWASEDVTDVQEAGDFDFQDSLRKFDKRTIFDEMKEKDQVEEADRLVSHNRKPKPGTAGGKNLHYTENVLETTTLLEKTNKAPPDDFWKSEADDGAVNGSERLSGRELGMGSRQSSRRGEGRPTGKPRSQSRKASAATVGQTPTRTNSGVSVQKATSRRRRRAKHADTQEKLLSGAPSTAGFIVAPSNRRIEILSPLQMLNLENIAQNDLGLTEDMMTENAARGISEVALHTLTDPAIRVRLAAADGHATEQPATVVILAGNNKSGYRSVAAGRHLRNKGLNVILCVVGIEKGERDLSVDMTKQLRLFKNFGGKVCNKSELFEFVRKASIPVISMDAPRSVLPQAPPMAVTLIIDALLGHVTPFEDLRASDQATVYELIEWTNRNEAFVLAVDVPTGVDHTTGRPTVQDGHSLYIRPRYVVSIGAPKKGLFEAIAAGATDDDDTVTGHASDDAVLDWNLFLIDIGLGAAVWKRAGTKIRKGIDFGNRWALQFKYQSSETDQAEE